MNSSFTFVFSASNSIEVLNNTMSTLVLDQIDNMDSVIIFNWLPSNYNLLTVSSEFMQMSSNKVFDNLFISIYVYVFVSMRLSDH